jgi:hypothetical protein
MSNGMKWNIALVSTQILADAAKWCVLYTWTCVFDAPGGVELNWVLKSNSSNFSVNMMQLSYVNDASSGSHIVYKIEVIWVIQNKVALMINCYSQPKNLLLNFNSIFI